MRPERRVAGALGLAAIYAAALLWIGPGGGLSGYWNFASAPWALGLGLLGVALAAFACVRWKRGPARAEPWSPGQHRTADLAAFCVGAALCFRFADQARGGDFTRVWFDIQNGVSLLKAEPLSPWLLGAFARAGAALGFGAPDGLQVGLALWGGLGFAALRQLAFAIADREPNRGLLAWVALGGAGSSALLFAHVETYTFAAVCMIFALASAIRASRGAGGAVTAIVVYTLACAFHMQMLCLGPAIAVAVAQAWDRGRRGLGAPLATRTLAGVGLGAIAATLALQWLCLQHPPPYPQYFGGGDGRMLVSGSQLFSAQHAAAVANQIALMGPGAALAIAAFAGRSLWKPGPLATLSAAGAGWLAFVLLWNPDLGAWRDWDLFAASGWWLTALAAALCLDEEADARAAWLLMPIAGINLARAIPFVLENHRAAY